MKTPTTSHSDPVDLNASAAWPAFVALDQLEPAARKLLVTDDGDLPILRTEYHDDGLHIFTDGGHGRYRYPLDGTVTVRNPQTSIAAIRAAAAR